MAESLSSSITLSDVPAVLSSAHLRAVLNINSVCVCVCLMCSWGTVVYSMSGTGLCKLDV